MYYTSRVESRYTMAATLVVARNIVRQRHAEKIIEKFQNNKRLRMEKVSFVHQKTLKINYIFPFK